MKNPYDTRDVQELQEIAFYWMQKAHNLSNMQKALMALMAENGLNPSIYDMLEKVNEIFKEEL